MPATVALTGLNYMRLAPITADTTGEYTVGIVRQFTGAVTVGADQSAADSGSSVPADDDPNWYEQKGSASNTEIRTITLGEISLENFAQVTGYKLASDGSLEMAPGARTEVPPFAVSFASVQPGNINYRMFKYYRGTIRAVRIGDINTRGGSAGAANIEIDMAFDTPNATGALMSRWKDGPLDVTYLTTFDDYEAAA